MHTPGPWEIIQLPSMEYRIDAKQGPLRVCPATAHGLDDARLIAAAPELLDAARKALNFIENTESELGIQSITGNALRTAIDKATKGDV